MTLLPDITSKARVFFSIRTKRKYYLIYTLLFFFTALICFSFFLVSGRSFIWHVDGWNQHFKALVYYSQYLRSIIRDLLSQHRLVILSLFGITAVCLQFILSKYINRKIKK